MIDYTKINSESWDKWVAEGNPWGIPISHEEYLRAKGGDLQIYLTPVKTVPAAWYPRLAGARVLGLASGGGQQMPQLAAAGAECTVFDNSEAQLASEKLVAAREGYDINIVRGDMTKPLPFRDGSFDLIVHPVSNIYIEDVEAVWRECFRVLKSGGILMAGLDNGLNFLFDDYVRLEIVHSLPFNPLKDPALLEQLLKQGDGVQFSHSIDEQIGGQLKAGLRLTDVFEDRDRPEADNRLPLFAPSYWATRSVKP